MNPLRMTALTFAMVALVATAGAQTAPPGGSSAGQATSPTEPMPHAMMPMGEVHAHNPMAMPPAGGHGSAGGMAGMSQQHMSSLRAEGQAAFGAIQEVVPVLQGDPHTDWSKVDIDLLRQHLIDMDEVTMHAVARKVTTENGLSIAVSGSGRTLEAIQRMVPDHAREIDGMNGWTVHTATMPDGVMLTVGSTDPAEVTKIRALGFMGIMVQGSHHQAHHLAMAKGELMHRHE
jgi:hypothetical protein